MTEKKRIPMTPARKLAWERMQEKGVNKTDAARRLGIRNLSYIQQWLEYAVPRILPERHRRELAALIDVDEARLIDDPDERKAFETMRQRRSIISGFDPDIPDPSPLFGNVSSDIDSELAAHQMRGLAPGQLIEREVMGGLGSGGYAKQLVVDGKTVDNATATWTLPVTFIRNELRAHERDLDIIPVDGTSMLPTLLPGDRVIVHRQARSPSPDGIFAIDDGIGTSIKRLQLVRGSDPQMVRIISDSDLHKEDIVPLDILVVLGRVICKISRL